MIIRIITFVKTLMQTVVTNDMQIVNADNPRPVGLLCQAALFGVFPRSIASRFDIRLRDTLDEFLEPLLQTISAQKAIAAFLCPGDRRKVAKAKAYARPMRGFFVLRR